jgi:hypothetical protein
MDDLFGITETLRKDDPEHASVSIHEVPETTEKKD